MAVQWLAVEEAEVPSGLDWLTAAEQARVARMRFTKRRNEYLLRRYAGKRAAAAVLLPDHRPDRATLARIGVLNRPGGAPYVEVDAVAAGVDISLTDRAGAAVALIGAEGSMASGTLGVDLEVVEPRSEGFVTDYLTPREQAWVRAEQAQGRREVAANLLWSGKEAALKVLQVGLRADTRSVEIEVHPGPVVEGWAPLRAVVAGGAAFPGWWRRDGAYLLTVTTRAAMAPPPLLTGGARLAEVVPAHSWMASPLVAPPLP